MAGGGGFEKGLVGEVLKIWKAEVLMPAFVPFSKKDLQILFWGSACALVYTSFWLHGRA